MSAWFISSVETPATRAFSASAAVPGGVFWIPQALAASRSEPGGSRVARWWLFSDC